MKNPKSTRDAIETIAEDILHLKGIKKKTVDKAKINLFTMRVVDITSIPNEEYSKLKKKLISKLTKLVEKL